MQPTRAGTESMGEREGQTIAAGGKSITVMHCPWPRQMKQSSVVKKFWVENLKGVS